MNATSTVTIGEEGTLIQETITFNNDLLSFDFSQPTTLQFNYVADERHKVVFHEDGRIDIDGDAELALQYLFDTCWTLIKNSHGYKDQTVRIFDYLVINFKDNTIVHKGLQIPDSFNEIKRVVEKVLLRKTKLKAFW